MDNSTRQRRASEDLVAVLRRGAAQPPLLVLVEDIHTASPRAYQKVIARVFAHWQALPEPLERAESWAMFSARAMSAVRDVIRRASPAEHSILVSSGGVIAAIVQQVLGTPPGGAYSLFEAMLNCSITHLLHNRERVSLSSFNDATYLRAHGQRRGQALITFR